MATYYISSGVTSTGLNVYDENRYEVLSGGVVNRTTVNSTGVLILSGGTANSTTVNYGGSMHVSSGGTADYALVDSGGSLMISSGGVVNGAQASSGGVVNVLNRGTLNGVEVYAGSLYVSAGGTLTGKMYFFNDSFVSFDTGSTLDFDLRQTKAGADALVNDYLYVGSAPSFTLTVDGTLSNGCYKLANMVETFTKTIAVMNGEGANLGTLKLGQTTNINGVDYSLNLDGEGVLSVTVDGAAPTADWARSDVNGNGVSDVMFQYTGGNYQLGFWMDGKDTWKGNGLKHPAEWDVLGAYDMNSNGKADAVLFGNVTSEAGIHGAYIGYYADSDDYDSNWVNIGYLHNEDNIDWKNKIGNLTGNSGKNSIVWYTYELGALGVWTDGTQDWIQMGTGFDATWSLVGCGDFNGDGKDQVVMSHNSADYYAIGIDGTWTNLGTSDSGWEVRAIGDFAGDGKDDIVAFHKETGIVAMWGNGNAANWSKLGQLDKKDWFVVGAGDYNGDAKEDLLVRQISTGMLGYYASGSMSNWVELGRGVDMNWAVIAG